MLMDQRLADKVFQFGEEFRVDLGLDLLPAEGALPFKTEHQRRGAAGQRFPPDAHRGPYTDIALVHLIVFEETDQAEGERRAEEADQVAGQTAEAEEAGSADAEETAGGEPADDVPVNAVESPESRKKKEMFGEDCIAE